MSFLFGIIGGIAGGMGLGGGTLLIPLLTLVGFSQLSAQGTNLLAFIPAASIALFNHYKAGRIDVAIAKAFCLWGIIGAVIGTVSALFLTEPILRRFFGIFIIILGIWQFSTGEKKFKGGKNKKA